MTRVFLISILLISSFGFGQAPYIEWQKSIGGLEDDHAHSVFQTTDGGYIVAGKTLSNDGYVTNNYGNWDFWVVKLNSIGDTTWQKSLGGFGFDIAFSIEQTTDGGYIVAGTSNSIDGDITENKGVYESWIVKLDPSGNIVWQKTIGGSGYDWTYSIQQTLDGGFIAVGKSDSSDGDVSVNNGNEDFWIVKLDSLGNILWENSFGGSQTDIARSVKQTTDGGYIIAGYSNSSDGDLNQNYGLFDVWILKLDTSGNIIWQKSLGGSGDDIARCIQQTTDGGYIIAGYSNSDDGDLINNKGNSDYWIIKLDASGVISWQKSLGGSGDEEAQSIQEIAGGGYVVAGSSDSSDGDVHYNNDFKDFWIIKLDVNGNLAWQKVIGYFADDCPHAIKQTVDEGFIVAGYGHKPRNQGLKDFLIIKLSPEITSLNKNKKYVFNLYPNPATKTFTISSDMTINSGFKIIDAQGKEVLSGKMNGKKQSIDISSLSKGAYSIVFGDSELPVLSVIKD